jgi:hypothetical protein
LVAWSINEQLSHLCLLFSFDLAQHHTVFGSFQHALWVSFIR